MGLNITQSKSVFTKEIDITDEDINDNWEKVLENIGMDSIVEYCRGTKHWKSFLEALENYKKDIMDQWGLKEEE